MRIAMALLVVSVVSVGCGARSGLATGRGSSGSSSVDDGAVASAGSGTGTDTGAGGAGNGSGAGGGSAATSGGAGGGPVTGCVALGMSGALTPIPSLGPGTSDNTRFHWLDDGRMTVAYRPFDPAKGLKLGSTTVDWLGGWPPKSAAPVELLSLSDESFAIDREPGPLLGLLAPAGGLGVSFGFSDPTLGGWKPSLSVDPNGDRAVFVRRSGTQYFLATEAPGSSPGGSYQLRATLTDSKSTLGPFNAGCHHYRMGADALALPAGWLLARTAPPTGSCNPSAPATLAAGVTVTLIADQKPSLGAELALGGSSNQIALAPRGADAAWLVHWSALTTVSALPLDGLGHPAGPALPLITLAESPWAFAVDRLDDGLVLAAYDATADGGGTLRLVVVNGTGQLLSTVEVPSPPKPTTPLQVAFHPGTRQVLLGYSGIVNAKQSVYLARFACN